MKIKTIARSTADYQRERVSGVERLQKNKDPRLHPFEQAREYTRAVRAVKLDKMFAKPFVAAMDDHSDAVWCTGKQQRALDYSFSFLPSLPCSKHTKLTKLSLSLSSLSSLSSLTHSHSLSHSVQQPHQHVSHSLSLAPVMVKFVFGILH